jgi:probable rRNA maturation factor
VGAAKSDPGDVGRPEPEAGGVEVLIDVAPRFRRRIDEDLLERAVREALNAARADRSGERAHRPTTPTGFPTHVPPHAEVGIHVTDDAEMQQLNAQYRHVDKPTDVLSFSFVDEEIGRSGHPAHPPGLPIQLGEIAISLAYAERQASELGHTLGKELAWLTIHGTLQLLGYTHYTEEQAVHMEALEQMALRAMGLA